MDGGMEDPSHTVQNPCLEAGRPPCGLGTLLRMLRGTVRSSEILYLCELSEGKRESCPKTNVWELFSWLRLASRTLF